MRLADTCQGPDRLKQLQQAGAPVIRSMARPAHDHPAIPSTPAPVTVYPPLQEMLGLVVPAQFQPQVVPLICQQGLPCGAPSGVTPDPATVSMPHLYRTGNPDIRRRLRLQILHVLHFDLPGHRPAHKTTGRRISRRVERRHLQPARNKIPHHQPATQHHAQARTVTRLGKFNPAIKASHVRQPGMRVAASRQLRYQCLHRPRRLVETVCTVVSQTEHGNRYSIHLYTISSSKPFLKETTPEGVNSLSTETVGR